MGRTTSLRWGGIRVLGFLCHADCIPPARSTSGSTTPFGMEGLESSAKLDLIERSMLASQLKWADYRDIGVTIQGQLTCPFTGVKIQPAAGVITARQNKLDANNFMAYAARLAVKPVDALHLGVAITTAKRARPRRKTTARASKPKSPSIPSPSMANMRWRKRRH